jgi:hypothetical protein
MSAQIIRMALEARRLSTEGSRTSLALMFQFARPKY